MKKIFTAIVLILFSYATYACYADYDYTNGCVGDTIFFQARDGYAAYTWDYGDTNSGVANISHDIRGYHIYSAPGDYYVTLFVNVGAEWDYLTNIIHIGAPCFAAAFKSTCGGSLYRTFSDFSSGAHATQFWDFGDPGSGNNDTATTLSPSHSFSAAGNYLITYIISNGMASDTIEQPVRVDSVCLSASIPNFTAALNCINDTVKMYAGCSPAVTYISWNFGNPSSGSADTSTLIQPSHSLPRLGFILLRWFMEMALFMTHSPRVSR